MKISFSMLKSLWLFAVVLIIFAARGLPVPVLIVLVVLALAAPLIREFRKKTDLDERQIRISHFSSHIAYYVYTASILLVMINEFISAGKNPDNVWYMLLLTPMVIKFYINLFQNYGAVQGARWIGYFFACFWILFVILSSGFSVEFIIGASPFIILLGAAWYSKKYPTVSGIIFLLIGAVGLYLYIIRTNFDIYLTLLMFTIVPLPILLSGIALTVFPKIGGDKE